MTIRAFAAAAPREVETREPAALHGVLPWRQARKTGLRVLLVRPQDAALWSVPLGAPVEGRAPFLSAALHAFEEAGVIGDIETSPMIDYRRGGGSGGRIVLHAMNVRGTLSHWKMQDERLRQWFTLPEAAERVADARLAELIRALAVEPQALTGARDAARAIPYAAAPQAVSAP